MIQKKRVSDFLLAEYGKLLNYARRLFRSSAGRDPEDLVQDVVASFFDRADVTAPIENLAAYFYRALKNRIVTAYRQESSRKTLSLNHDGFPEGNKRASLADFVRDQRAHTCSVQERQELYRLLYRAINELSEKERTVIVATEFEEISFRELSLRLDVPIGTLLARKSRALRKIHLKIQEHL